MQMTYSDGGCIFFFGLLALLLCLCFAGGSKKKKETIVKIDCNECSHNYKRLERIKENEKNA